MTDCDEANESDPPSSDGTTRLTITLVHCSQEVRPLVRRAARQTLSAEGLRSGRLEIAFVDEAAMRRHHQRWMGRDVPTDVLAFDLQDGRTPGCVDGQLIVCESTARQEAQARKTDWRGELLLYVVHGCLHLCGYDDRRAADFERMHRREDELLAELGWQSVFEGRCGSSEVGAVVRRPGRVKP